MGYTGKDVKVGIIDWGFTDWNKAARVTNLPTMVKGAEKGEANANAFCQPVTRSIVPDSVILLGVSHTCEPTAALSKRVNHGTNVGQLVMDMAPGATLYLAQANSPRQLYKAAKWLKSKNVDVIVHAGGWPYDSPGDGTAYFNLTHYNDSTLPDVNEDSPRRYYPSPLFTVDEVTSSSGGPVWINAAGNAEQWTLNLRKPRLINDGDSDYHGYVIFHPGKKKPKDQTCQKVPIVTGGVYYLSMRWADSWPNGKYDLEYEMQRSVLGFGRDYLVDTEFREQHTTSNNYPIRKSSVLAWRGYDVCLRIKVDTPKTRTPVSPAWIQFQGLVSKDNSKVFPAWGAADETGSSIVNPAESSSGNLIAVGARNMRAKTPKVFDYSSRGPVFAKGADVVNTSPGRIKPDLTAGSGAATYIKWLRKCNMRASRCGEDLYFGGTSGATGHTGGLAAVVIGYHDKLGLTPTSSSIVNLLRLLAVDEGDAGAENTWGRGFLELPCPSKVVTLPHTSSGADWKATDCESETASGRSDYYTFTVSSKRQFTISLSSTTHAHLRLATGVHSRKMAFITRTNGVTGGRAQIKRELSAGTYTLEVATNDATATGAYTVKISADDIPNACMPVTDFTAQRVGSKVVNTTWTNPTDGLTATQRTLEVRVWDPDILSWKFVININEPAASTSSRHVGAAASRYYAYRATSKCGSSSSDPSPWQTVRPIPSDSAQGSSGDEIPTPTPVPQGASGASGAADGSRPPAPR